MYPINMENDTLSLRDMGMEELHTMLKWYNASEDFMFATGVDAPVSFETIKEKYLQSFSASNEFLAGIRLKKENAAIGLVKGRLDMENAASVWISLFAIDPDYRGRGYGRLALDLLMDGLVKKTGLKAAYLVVARENARGRKFWLANRFREIGEIRDHADHTGRRWDLVVMCRRLC